MAVTVLQAYHFCTVSVPTAAFLPDFCRLHNRHHDFLAACMVHLFTDNIFDFFNNTPSQWQIGVHAIGGFTHKTGTQQQLMARDFSLGRNLTQMGAYILETFINGIPSSQVKFYLFQQKARLQADLREPCAGFRPCGIPVPRRCAGNTDVSSRASPVR